MYLIRIRIRTFKICPSSLVWRWVWPFAGSHVVDSLVDVRDASAEGWGAEELLLELVWYLFFLIFVLFFWISGGCLRYLGCEPDL